MDLKSQGRNSGAASENQSPRVGGSIPRVPAPRIPFGRWAGPWVSRLPGQGIHAGRPCCRRLGGEALAARALLHGAAGAAGGKGRSDLRGCRAGGAEGGVRRAGAAVRPAPARERHRKRPCSPRLHRARGLQGTGDPAAPLRRRSPRAALAGVPAPPLGTGVRGRVRRRGRRACGRRGSCRNTEEGNTRYEGLTKREGSEVR